MLCFFFNDPATTEIYTLSLHDALPISVVRDLDDATVAGLDAAHHDDAGCRRLDGRAGLGLDVDAGVPAAAPPAEGGGHGALDGPDEHPAELVRVGHSELEVLRDARARRPRRGPRGGALARVVL